jgi:crotonobetainyl-CoA:carnitine CoA-transferase CaiB-like acyl-CoA transferase
VTLDDGRIDWAAVGEHVHGSTTARLVERAAFLGLACSIIGEETDGQPAKPERVGDADPGSLSDLVVANLGALWAAPLAADVLARLGARVLTIESIRRPDGARSTERFFAALHGRTESVALELDRPGGQDELRRLLARVDIVIEASRPRALRHMGIDGRGLARTGPRVWVALTAHGQSQPDRVGFGDDAAAAGGLVGWRDGAPVFLADAIADPLAGLTIADCVRKLVDGGGRWYVDVALSRVARSCARGPRSPTESIAEPPRPRSEPGARLELGRDTEHVLREFGVR